MIEMTTRRGTNFDNRTWLLCRKCNSKNVFFRIIPEKCEVCGAKFPEVGLLRSNIEARIKFYKSLKES